MISCYYNAAPLRHGSCYRVFHVMKILRGLGTRLGLAALFVAHVRAADLDTTIGLTITNGIKILDLPLVSGVDEFKILRGTNVTQPFTESSSGTISGYQWKEAGTPGNEFFAVEMRPKSSNEVVTA